MSWRPLLLLLAVTAWPAAVPATTFTIINNDPAGQGFNDPTPAAPTGGNRDDAG